MIGTDATTGRLDGGWWTQETKTARFAAARGNRTWESGTYDGGEGGWEVTKRSGGSGPKAHRTGAFIAYLVTHVFNLHSFRRKRRALESVHLRLDAIARRRARLCAVAPV